MGEELAVHQRVAGRAEVDPVEVMVEALQAPAVETRRSV
eukprot:SAG11_NODE_29491_length_310_cov_0.966825_1_plen_38_part_10